MFPFKWSGGIMRTTSYEFQTVSPLLENWSIWTRPLTGAGLYNYYRPRVCKCFHCRRDQIYYLPVSILLMCLLGLMNYGSSSFNTEEHFAFSFGPALLSVILLMCHHCKEFPTRVRFLKYILAPSAFLRQKTSKTIRSLGPVI